MADENIRSKAQVLGKIWDNSQVTILSSAAYTTTFTSQDYTNFGATGIQVFTNVSSVNAGTPSITVAIQGKDSLSGKYYTLITGGAMASVSTQRTRAHPRLTAGTNIGKDVLPKTFRIVYTHADTQPITYSSAYELILT